jgi:hypothetical protein
MVESALRRCVAAEKGLRTGRFEATIDYGGGHQATVQIRFDLGDTQAPPRLHIVSTFHAGTGSQTSEHVAIGAQTWQKTPDGRWEAASTGEGVWERVGFYLPNAHTITRATASGSGDHTALHYHDTVLSAEAHLTVDRATGRPLQLRREVRSTGVVTTVDYREWNTAVVIAPPDIH